METDAKEVKSTKSVQRVHEADAVVSRPVVRAVDVREERVSEQHSVLSHFSAIRH